MNIIFIHFGLEFDADSLNRGPLGGTETALIGISRALAKDPQNKVLIFTNTPQENTFDGVIYKPVKLLAEWSQNNEADVLISIRQWIPFWLPLRAKLKIYFSPDAFDQPFLHRAFEVGLTVNGEVINVPFFPPKDFFNYLDHIFCVGKWQAGTFVNRLGFPKDKIFVTANAVFLENFKPKALSERLPHLMYSSTPFRGLEHLVKYFPAIKNGFPDINLEVCSGMQVYGVSDDQNIKDYGDLYAKLKSLNAISHGAIRQKKLAQIMCQNLLYAYPNNFEETFCISVLEAQAAGLPVVTSDRGALPERLTDGIEGYLIKGDPNDDSYQRDFVQASLKILNDQSLWEQMSVAAKKRAKAQSYENLAKEWVDFFKHHLTSTQKVGL
ncbi:hypothetical protein BVY03_04775, partial [bacterium K02(2017)]